MFRRKMHVTSVASDLLNKHMSRINQDYKLILLNNEIPESIRIGPLNHPAMINDAANGNTNSTTNNSNSSQSQRSESRREALAAKKASKEDDLASTTTGGKKKKKETSPNNEKSGSAGATSKREIEMRVRMEIMEDMPMVIRIVIRRKRNKNMMTKKTLMMFHCLI